MKKIISCFLVCACILTAMSLFAGCDKKADTNEIEPFTCEIKFAKTVNEKYEPTELYEGDEFKINTKIYVIVDFTMTNYGTEDDEIDFIIRIPYAKYYSTYEYNKGVIVPTEEIKDTFNDDGTKESRVELSGMVFHVKKGQTPFHYTYCFTIEANSVCKNVEFKAILTSYSGKVAAQKGKGGYSKEWSKKYSFIDEKGDDIQ